MPNTQGYSEGAPPIPDRRGHSRRRALPLAYVDLGKNNGGIVLNISAGGLAITTVEPLYEEHLPRLRFQLPESNAHVEAIGQIAWTSDTKKEAGLRFVDLSEEAARQINNWLSSEAPGSELPSRREDFHASTRRPFSTLMATPHAPAAIEKAIPNAAEEEAAEPPIAGGSFTAALQNSKTPIAARPSAENTMVVVETKSAHATQMFGAVTEFRTSQPRWWALTAVVSLFAVISFGAGIAAGGGGWQGMKKLFSRNRTPSSEPARVSEDANQSDVQGAPDSAADGAAKPGAESSSAKSQDFRAPARIASADHSPLQGAAPDVSIHGAPEKNNSEVLIQLPETPVSASPSVAITSRRSVQIASEGAVQTPRHGKDVQFGQLYSHVEPFYPAEAERQGVEGTVELHAIVGIDGRIRNVHATDGPPLLAGAAVGAVREWRYKPTLLNGQPIESEVDVKIIFRVPRQ
jgi:TonB family protein